MVSSAFYDFCGFWSVAVNNVYKLQSLGPLHIICLSTTSNIRTKFASANPTIATRVAQCGWWYFMNGRFTICATLCDFMNAACVSGCYITAYWGRLSDAEAAGRSTRQDAHISTEKNSSNSDDLERSSRPFIHCPYKMGFFRTAVQQLTKF